MRLQTNLLTSNPTGSPPPASHDPISIITRSPQEQGVSVFSLIYPHPSSLFPYEVPAANSFHSSHPASSPNSCQHSNTHHRSSIHSEYHCAQAENNIPCNNTPFHFYSVLPASSETHADWVTLLYLKTSITT